MTMDKHAANLKSIGVLGFLAVFGVMGWHYAAHFHATPLATIMAPFYRRGLLLVDYLFVLAGFVAAAALVKPGPAAGRKLIAATLARLYPLHLITLCVVALMQWYLSHRLGLPPFIYKYNDTYYFVLNLTLLNHIGFDQGMSFNGPASFVSTIVVVVTIFALCNATGRRLSRVLNVLCFAFALVAVLHYTLVSSEHVLGLVDMDVFRTLLGFLTGVATFKLYRRISDLAWPAWLGDALASLAATIAVLYLARWNTSSEADIALVLVAFPALTLGVLQGKLWRSILQHPLVAWTGNLGISMYLIHFPLQLATHLCVARWGLVPPYEYASFLIAFTAVTIALSWLSRKYVEVPAMRLLLGRTQQPAPLHDDSAVTG